MVGLVIMLLDLKVLQQFHRTAHQCCGNNADIVVETKAGLMLQTLLQVITDAASSLHVSSLFTTCGSSSPKVNAGCFQSIVIMNSFSVQSDFAYVTLNSKLNCCLYHTRCCC